MKAIAALFVSAFLILPVHAQDAPVFTGDDEMNLQQCIEAVNDTLSAEPDSQSSLTECIGVASNACQAEPEGSSTQGIIACNQREASWWDQYLNGAYEPAETMLEPAAFTSLKTAQRAWLKFRDAECSFEYERYGDSSMRNIAQTGCMMTQTAQRAIDLYALSEEGY